MGDALLEVTDLAVGFGGVRALDGVSLEVPRGALVGLIGPNGAGKTTFIDAVSGGVAHRGQVRLGGLALESLPAHQRARNGLARTWQSVELFDDLTVAENCLVAVHRGSTVKNIVGDLLRPGRHHGDAAVRRALESVGLADRADDLPVSLSLGQRKLLGVARAMAAEPQLLLLDEPAAGLDTDESQGFGDTLRAIAASGVAVLLVDHDMGLVLGVCEQVHVLDAGRLIASGAPADVRVDSAVITAYLGEGAAP